MNLHMHLSRRPLRAAASILGIAVLALSTAAISGSAGATAAPRAGATAAWAGSWTGTVTATPTPACVKGAAGVKGACPNPFEVVVDINDNAGGAVKYPLWKCAGTLTIAAVTATQLNLTVAFSNPGPFDCPDVQGTLTSLGPGYATWDVTGGGESYSGVLSTPSVPPTCQGSGSCGVQASSPQVVCLSAATCPPGGTLTSTVSVAAFSSGAIAPNTPVTVKFLSTSSSTTSGSWCQGANGTEKTGRTNSKGLFQFSYTTAGLNVPSAPSFCMMKVTVGRYSVYAAIDQTNDPAPWKVTGAPTSVSRVAVPSAHARFGLTVKNPSHYVFGDPTTFYSEVPSIPGACGSFSPLVKKTSRPHGKATISYSPSTVWANHNKAYCTLIGQEADTGAISNKVIVYQKK